MIDEYCLSESRTVHIVRHDRVPGGTKRLVLPGVLRSLGVANSCTYASPAYGYAQLAIAHACRDIGASANVFVADRKLRTRVTELAVQTGAVVHGVRPGYLSVVQKRAAEFSHDSGSTLLPFGLDCEPMIDAITDLAKRIDYTPRTVWVTSGSGTLWKGLSRAWSSAHFQIVQVGRKIPTDWADGVSYTLHTATERFEQPAKTHPPYPSAVNYDAKAWQFIVQYAQDGDLVWNTAG